MRKIIILIFVLNYIFANEDFQSIKKSCEEGDKNSCYTYAWMHYNENDSSNVKVKSMLNKLCNEDGHSRSCYDLGDILYQINTKEYINKACDLGLLEACYTLAKINDDCALMQTTLQKAKKEKNDKVQALIYLGSECIKKNEAKAQEFSQKACMKGDNLSCEIYHRVIFQKNNLIKTTLENAYKKCNDGIEKCFWLIQIYRYGFLGESKNYEKAANIAINSCAKGNALACFTLADIELRGYKADFDKVKEAISKGCELGNPIMCDFIKDR